MSEQELTLDNTCSIVVLLSEISDVIFLHHIGSVSMSYLLKFSHKNVHYPQADEVGMSESLGVQVHQHGVYICLKVNSL